eukprot:7262732-Prymnesium_polylepis.1
MVSRNCIHRVRTPRGYCHLWHQWQGQPGAHRRSQRHLVPHRLGGFRNSRQCDCLDRVSNFLRYMYWQSHSSTKILALRATGVDLILSHLSHGDAAVVTTAPVMHVRKHLQFTWGSGTRARHYNR